MFGQVPGFTDNVFPKRSLPYLNALGQLGAILYCFNVGISVDIEKFKQLWKQALASSLVGLALCFALAPGLQKAFDSPQYYTNANVYEFSILIANVLFISALAVLARILAERKMLVTKLGSITMATTAVDTLFGWIVLAAVLALYTSRVPVPKPDQSCGVVISPADAESQVDPLYIVLVFIGFIIVLVLVVRPYMTYFAQREQRRDKLEAVVFFAVISMTFACAWFTQTLTVSGMFGAFCVGAVSIPRIGPLPSLMRQSLEKLVVVVFLPVFFAVSGLRTNWTILDGEAVGLAYLLVASVYVTKSLGCFLAAWVLNLRGFKTIFFAALMSAKGLTVIAFLNICLDVGIITKKLFSLCVLFSLSSTIFASPIIRLIQVFERRHKMQRAVPVDTVPMRVLAVPRTAYYAPIVVDLAYWLALDHMPSKVVAARLIHADEGLDDLYKPGAGADVLRKDDVLGAAIARFDHIGAMLGGEEGPKFELKAIGVPEGARDLVDFVTGLDDERGKRTAPYQYVVIGDDNISVTEQYISALVDETAASIITYIGVPGVQTYGFHNFARLIVVFAEGETEDDCRATRIVIASLRQHHPKLRVETAFAPAAQQLPGSGDVPLNRLQRLRKTAHIARHGASSGDLEGAGSDVSPSNSGGADSDEVVVVDVDGEDRSAGAAAQNLPGWAAQDLADAPEVKLNWTGGLREALEHIEEKEGTLVLLPRLFREMPVTEYLLLLRDTPCPLIYVESHSSQLPAENLPNEQ